MAPKNLRGVTLVLFAVVHLSHAYLFLYPSPTYNQPATGVQYTTTYTLVRTPYGSYVRVILVPVNPQNPGPQEVTTTTTTPAPPPRPPRPVVQPAVFFGYASLVPMKLYSTFLCGTYNLPAPILGRRALLPVYDPVATLARLSGLSSWLRNLVTNPLPYMIGGPEPVLVNVSRPLFPAAPVFGSEYFNDDDDSGSDEDSDESSEDSSDESIEYDKRALLLSYPLFIRVNPPTTPRTTKTTPKATTTTPRTTRTTPTTTRRSVVVDERAKQIQNAALQVAEIFKNLSSALLSGLNSRQLSELRSILLANLTLADLEQAVSVVFNNITDLARNASNIAKSFYASSPTSTSLTLADSDNRRLQVNLILTLNGRRTVNFQTAGEIARVLLRSALPQSWSEDKKQDAVTAMMFLGNANLTSNETTVILDNLVHDYMTSDPYQDLITYIRSSSGAAARRKRHLYYQPQFDQDMACYSLYNYAVSSKYCGVRISARLVYDRLKCSSYPTTTSTTTSTTTTRPATTTSRPTTTSTTTRPTTTTTRPTTTSTTTRPTTTTTTRPTTTTTKPTTTTTRPTTTTTTTPRTTTTTRSSSSTTKGVSTSSTATPTTTTTTTTTSTTTTTPTTTTTSTTTTTPTTTSTTTTPTTTTTTTTPTTTSSTSTTTRAAPTCGVSDVATSSVSVRSAGLFLAPRIVGGVNAGSCAMYPWMVRLNVDDGQVCGGVILDATHILTAAHCAVNKNSIQATVGEYDTTVTEGPEQVFNINTATGVALHPNFDYIAKTNDVAVLTLETPINLNQICAKPICLDPTYKVTSGQKCQIAGWGVTDENSFSASNILQTASITTYQGPDCQAAFPNSGSNYLSDPTKQLCAGEQAGGVDACGGDSGGPLFCLDQTTNRWVAAGIVSYGEGCARPEYPGVYADTSVYYDWIQQQL